jgi:uncharacterized membrane protein
MPTITAGFNDLNMAVKAGGALLDHGIKKDQFDLLAGEAHEGHLRARGRHLEDLESKVEGGVTTTTGADAAEGAKQGAAAGAVLGALAGLASLFIPGYGIVVGGGALATALATAAGTAAAGAATGGVTGYLKDMGVDDEAAADFDRTIRQDGAIIVLHLPVGGTAETAVRQILDKYHAVRVHSSEHTVV